MPAAIKYWLPVIIYAIIIFLISSIPGKDIPPIFRHQNEVFHFLEYAGLSILLNRALKNANPVIPGLKRFFLAVILSLLYALSDEWHQSFVPGRSASLYDAGFDGAGIFITSLVYTFAARGR